MGQADHVGEAVGSAARQFLFQFADDARARRRVMEDRRADAHHRRAGQDQLQGIPAGPYSPPVVPARTGRRVAGSIVMPSRVLIIDRPSAPALTQALAIATMSVTSGDSFANTGMS